MGKHIIVITGNHEQYLTYLRENGLTPQQAIYVTRKDQIRGLRDCKIVRFGTYWKNPVNDDPYLQFVTNPNQPNHPQHSGGKES